MMLENTPLKSSKSKKYMGLCWKSTKCNQMIRFPRKESSPLQLLRFLESLPLRGLQVFSFSVCCISLVIWLLPSSMVSTKKNDMFLLNVLDVLVSNIFYVHPYLGK